VQLLVGRGANVEHENKLGHTTLIQAVEVGDERMVELLLDKGADIERKDPKFKFAPLVWAIREGCEEVVQLLVKRGANL
ncbi:ankyrin, partial [Lentithecium fluviatile CBS 122367]